MQSYGRNLGCISLPAGFLRSSLHSWKTGMTCWREGRAEVQFICEVDGVVIPVEVKSGWVTQAKSLRVFTQKYAPPYCIVFSARNFVAVGQSKKRNYPLYLASKFPLS
jgi:hypothetical protein